MKITRSTYAASRPSKRNWPGWAKQIPYAASRALNATGQAVVSAMPAELEKTLDRPTHSPSGASASSAMPTRAALKPSSASWTPRQSTCACRSKEAPARRAGRASPASRHQGQQNSNIPAD